MAAHDEKISQNRRKLFKALSAAPVVATLAPGQAAAQASAFQCLNNIVGETTPPTPLLSSGVPISDPGAPGEIGGDGSTYAYMPVPTWTIVNPPDGVVPGATKMCPVTHPLLGLTVAALPTSGTADMGSWGDYVFFDVATQLPIANQNLIQFNPMDPTAIDILEADGSDTCIVALAQNGEPAYALVESTISADRTDWSLAEPPRLYTQWSTTSPGTSKPDVYGITSTCIVSVHPDMRPGYLYLNG